jgi:DNA-binding NtrC family response regulator
MPLGKVLFVDDDQSIRETVRIVLQRAMNPWAFIEHSVCPR